MTRSVIADYARVAVQEERERILRLIDTKRMKATDFETAKALRELAEEIKRENKG